MRKKLSVFFILFATVFCSFAQSGEIAKQLPAQRLVGKIIIDGSFNDSAWASAPEATNFVEFRPSFGKPENQPSRTSVKILYDDNFIYIGGHCFETSKDSISQELVGRDNVGANDFLGVIFDTYNDKINASGFYVTPLGEQFDSKFSNTSGEDRSWNAVWFSECKIIENGWTFEMKIPYSALRFSKNGTVWGLNITRRRNKTGQQYFWNPVSPTVNGLINQEGLWTGITDIKSPLRLSLSPYFSAYANHYPYNTSKQKNTTQSINGGLDVKYGINQNYTLDATLIPDFGQVQSDRNILNLSPFEVRYDENRAFFTEGTELFSKGNLFYSRRVGGTPIHKFDINSQLGPNDEIIANPSETKLANATKLSGRNQKGLGLGLFNAVTKPMYATAQNKIDGTQYKLQTSTLTNYNILVADQTLKNNSSVSLINTSVIRSGHDYDANVTAGIFDLNNKKNTYNLNGKVVVSNLSSQGKSITGYAHNLSLGKTGGRLNVGLNQDLANEKYNINDLGILFNNNYVDHDLYIGYRWLTPAKWYNNIRVNFNNNFSHRFSDGAFQNFNTNINANSQLKNLMRIGTSLGYSAKGNDFYEPRVSGKVFKYGSTISSSFFIARNDAKKYFADVAVRFSKSQLLNGHRYYVGAGQRYRFNNKFSLATNFTYNFQGNNVGFAALNNNNIIFSKRDRKTSENTLNAKYSFSNKAGITMAVRHYWSQVKVTGFYNLQNDGSLQSNMLYNENKNFNVNLFNVDMVYTWQFGPGSFVNVVWKNAIADVGRDISKQYFKNLGNTFGVDQNNNVSIKILYFLDYQSIKKAS